MTEITFNITNSTADDMDNLGRKAEQIIILIRAWQAQC